MKHDAFDASSEPPAGFGPTPSQPERQPVRPFVGVHFQCCSVYCRVYLNPEEKQSLGFCPRCGRRIVFVVADSGTSERFFTAY